MYRPQRPGINEIESSVPDQLSGPPFFAALQCTERLAPRFLRLPSPARGDRRAKVPGWRLRDFLPAGATWWCPESARSTVSVQAARRVRSEQVLLSSVARICQADPPAPDSLSGSLP